ncbi:MAG: TetR/AcrR family transcriptional regulator [Prevotella sp.]
MQKTATATLYRQELKIRILKKSMEAFKAKGIKSVKMDDLASELSISKRTLYEIYSNKEQLLLEALHVYEAEHDEHMKTFAADPTHNVIDILLEFYNWQIRRLENINPAFFSEMAKYKTVIDYLHSKHEEREKNSHMFFERGVREGYFRKNVHFGILSDIGNACTSHVMESRMYKKYDMDMLMHNIILLFIRGICTKEGVELLDRSLGE